MSRNNPERIGSDAHPAEAPAATPAETNNSLSFVTPTEFIDLPSRGLFYPQEHPLCGQDTVEIKLMTAKEEDILADRNLLKKGLSIDRLLRNIIIDRRINPDDLLVGDKNAILVACRIGGYGEEYNTKVICPVCFSHGKHDFDLSNVKIHVPENLEEMNIRSSGNGTFLVVAPKTNIEVELRLLTGHEEKALLNNAARRRKQNLPEQALTDQLRMLIISVNGQEDKNTINSFIESLPAADSRYIRTAYQECAPGIDMKENYECIECGNESEVDIPFTTSFFWPDV